MSRYWVTILMAVVLAGLGAYVYYVDLPAERAQTAKETAEKQLLSLTEKDITGLTVRTAGQEIVLVAGPGRTWQITNPLATEADAQEVDGILRALVLGKITRVVAEQVKDLSPFGLESPSVVLTVKGKDKEETLSLGDTGPMSSTLYAMRNSDRRVFLTDLAARDLYNKTFLTLRKKTVLDIEETKVTRVRLTVPPTEIVLYRVQDHKDSKWMVRFPIETQADQPEVRKLLLKLEDLVALGFIDPGPEHQALMAKLNKVKAPAARIVVHEGGRDNGTDQTVRLYQLNKDSGEAYAITTPEAPIFRVNPMVIKDLTKDLFTLRDKRLLGVNSEDIAMLTVKTRDGAYTLIRQNDTWVLEALPTQPLDQQTVAVFVSRVADLPAELQVVKRVGPLTPYGLASPAAEFTATSTDGKQAGRLLLGTKVGGLVYVMGEGLPGIYQARSDILTQIPAQQELMAKAPDKNAPPP